MYVYVYIYIYIYIYIYSYIVAAHRRPEPRGAACAAGKPHAALWDAGLTWLGFRHYLGNNLLDQLCLNMLDGAYRGYSIAVT